MLGPGRRSRRRPADAIIELFDEAGYIGVVATNCEQTYHRYLRVGERGQRQRRAHRRGRPEADRAGRGLLHHQRITWQVGDEDVAEMNWRIMKFRPADANGRPCPTIWTPTP